MLAQLEPWSFQIEPGFRMRGWRTEFSGKPLIYFLHGNGFCGLTYLPMLKALIDDFDLIISDLPGHGDSDVGRKFAPWNGSAKCALDVLHYFSQQLPEGTKVYGLGHSYGGVITGLMAGRDPSCFDKCLLLDPVIFSKNMLNLMKAADFVGLLDNTKLAKSARNRNQHWPNRVTAYKALRGKGGFKNWSDESLHAYVSYALTESRDGVSLKCPAKIEAKIYSSYPNRLWSYLKKVSMPCKILMAKKSFPFIRDSVGKLSHHPAYSIDTIEGGHCFMQEQPQVAAEQIKAWLLA